MLQHVAIFGAGVSGLAARRLAVALGFEVCLFDEGGAGDVSAFTSSDVNSFDCFVFSPGFAQQHASRVVAEGSVIPCYSELGFAAQYWRGKVLGITGTNGKTTLTSLLQSALLQAGHVAVEAGNIGIPLSDYVLDAVNSEEAYAVCEVSSFQAELPLGLQLDGLIWSNFAEDHLDRYSCLADYFAAKAKLLDCLKAGAPCVLGADVVAYDARVASGRSVEVVAAEVGVSDELDVASPFRVAPQSVNYALAGALWQALALPVDALVASANCFRLAAHRCSRVSQWGGVDFWDDSKATNFHAALAAVNAIDRPVFWIGGGSFKGGDLAGFAGAMGPLVDAAFVYGAVAEPLAVSLRAIHDRVEVYSDFTAAVEAATLAALANTPCSVLLSPGFASFDQFSSYAARGKSFISTVLSLKEAHQPN